VYEAMEEGFPNSRAMKKHLELPERLRLETKELRTGRHVVNRGERVLGGVGEQDTSVLDSFWPDDLACR